MKDLPHGGDVYGKDKIELDFSINLNPLGMPENIKKALCEKIDSFEVYPDIKCRKLKNTLALYEKCSKEKIVCGNGAADLIFRIVLAQKPKNALLIVPSFSEYEKALKVVSCNIQYHILKEENEFCLTKDILIQINKGLDLLFLCNPNNPVGNRIERALLEEIIFCCKENKVFLIVDECFLDLTEEPDLYSAKNYLSDFSNLIVLKALTKTFAIAGLRLGYLLCHNPDLLRGIEECAQSWSVSVPAQIAGEAILSDKTQLYLEKARTLIKKERFYLENELKILGYKVFHSDTNFIFFKGTLGLKEYLLERNILIRDCSNYKQLQNGYYRIAIKRDIENKRLISTLKKRKEYLQ